MKCNGWLSSEFKVNRAFSHFPFSPYIFLIMTYECHRYVLYLSYFIALGDVVVGSAFMISLFFPTLFIKKKTVTVPIQITE